VNIKKGFDVFFVFKKAFEAHAGKLKGVKKKNIRIA
jgi:hypothetical protein